MKRVLAMIIIIVLAAGFAACSAPAITEETAPSAEAPAAEPTETQSLEPTTVATPEPTPEPTPNPAEVFAQERGVVLPDIDGYIITDVAEIESLIRENPYWAVQDNYDRIMWFKETGRYRIFTDYAGDMYIDGNWYFENDKLCTETVTSVTRGKKYKNTVVAAELSDGIHLYMCSEAAFGDYIPATDEEKNIVSTDPEVIANLRYFLCSASWELSGHYDEDGNFSDRSPDRVYTFLRDGQLVVRENGENVPGFYTLNIGDNGFYDLEYLLENGQAFDTPLYVDNSSSYASTFFIYPEKMSNESDLYWAIHTKDVSDVVTVGEPIQVLD